MPNSRFRSWSGKASVTRKQVWRPGFFFFFLLRGLCNSSFQPQTECWVGHVIFNSKGPSMLEAKKMFKGKLWPSSYLLGLLGQKNTTKIVGKPEYREKIMWPTNTQHSVCGWKLLLQKPLRRKKKSRGVTLAFPDYERYRNRRVTGYYCILGNANTSGLRHFNSLWPFGK